MKKSKIIIFATLLAASLGISTLVGLNLNGGLNEIYANNLYELTIDKNNGALAPVQSDSYNANERKTTAYTTSNLPVTLGCKFAIRNDQMPNIAFQLGKKDANKDRENGTVYNISAITNIKRISVSYTNGSDSTKGKLKVAVGKTKQPKTFEEFEQSPAIIENLDGSDYFFNISANGSAARILSINVTYSCTKYIEGDSQPTPEPGGGSQDNSSSESSSQTGGTLVTPGSIKLNTGSEITGKSSKAGYNVYDSKSPLTAKTTNQEDIRLGGKVIFDTATNPTYAFQIAKSEDNGELYNLDKLPNITKVEIEVTKNDGKISFSKDGTTYENVTNIAESFDSTTTTIDLTTSGYGYFKIEPQSGYIRIITLNVYYG